MSLTESLTPSYVPPSDFSEVEVEFPTDTPRVFLRRMGSQCNILQKRKFKSFDGYCAKSFYWALVQTEARAQG